MMNEIDYYVNLFTLESVELLLDDEFTEEEVMHGLMLMDRPYN